MLISTLESAETFAQMKSYFGSKAASGLYQNIIAMMPPHDTYIETHLGGGAVMKRKPPTRNNIGLDLDPQALASFQCDYPVQLIGECAHDYLAKYEFTGRELIFCDPPYLVKTRSSDRKYHFDYTEQDHIALLELLKSMPCHIILSGYPSALYEEHLGAWNNLELQAMTRGGPRTEKLWFNFKLDQLYWARYAGKNFTDRQRIKRKAESWGRRYQALPKAERLAVLATIMAVEATETA